MSSHDPHPEPEDLGTYLQFEPRDDDPGGATTPHPSPRTEAAPDPTPFPGPSRPARSPFGPGPSECPSAPAVLTPPVFPTPDPAGERSPSGPFGSGSLGALALPAEIRPGMLLFQKYRTVRRLGRGGMGEVWLVENVQLSDERALKLILPGQAFSADARERFRREARLMARVKHPCSVQVHDSNVGEAVAYIEMEYLQGESLDRLLRRGEPAPLPWVLGVLGPLCRVLDHIHRRPERIIHRDLKPSNLMLLGPLSHDPGGLKLLDLGIAKSLVAREPSAPAATFHTGSGAMLFTAQYASPEQINQAMSGDDGVGSPDAIDHRADLYALGVILYQFLTGHLPFEGGFQAVLLKQLNEAPPPFKVRNPQLRLHDGLERLVMRCLEKDRARRPQSAGEVYADFSRYVPVDPGSGHLADTQPEYPALWPRSPGERSDTESYPSAALPAPRKPKRRRSAVAAVAVGSVAAAGWYYGTRSTTPGPAVVPPAATATATATVSSPAPPSPLPRALAERGYKPDPAAASAGGLPARVTLALGKREVGFVLVPGREFTVGFDGPATEDPDSPLAEALPPRPVRVKTFYMQEFEATNGELQAFFDSPRFAALAASRRATPEALKADWAPLSPQFRPGDESSLPRGLDYPACGVVHELAEAYAAWVGGRLPTEVEWEFAARSGGGKVLFPWDRDGEPLDPDQNIKHKAVLDSLDGRYELGRPEDNPDRSAQGVYNLIGNLREWCRDRYASRENSFFRAGGAADPNGPAVSDGSAPNEYVVRGGSYMTRAACVSAYSPRSVAGADAETRERVSGAKAAREIGFRVVIELGR